MNIIVIDILKGDIERKISDNISEYIKCFNESAKQIKPPFEIEFEGLIVSDNAILVKRFYDSEL